MTVLSVDDVVDFILDNNQCYYLTHRKLQKILYYCQGVHLAKTGVPLFKEKIEAWDFGPVCPSVYHKLKHNGGNALHSTAPADQRKFTKESMLLILSVLAFFGEYNQNELIEFTHIDVPWASNYVQYENNELKIDVLKDYFSSFSSFSQYIEHQNKRMEFKSLIQSRRAYLISLQNLGDNWLSSPSKSPSKKSTKLASDILSLARNLVNQRVDSSIPKLVMGPIPSGGVGIEFDFNNLKRLFVNIYDDNLVEFDIEDSGFFTDEDSSFDYALSTFNKIYMELS
ncbi:hypothetical protein HLBENOHH_01965 [Aeromonas dhakensis]|uniref:Panacea domain-containing protein n=1 Tax=Aeromonas TaxID=642 RepID=UPI0036720320